MVEIIKEYVMVRVGIGLALHRAVGGGMMKAFLATVLSVIAVGVLLIAYGLFNPRVGERSRPISPPVRCSRANASD